MNEMTPRERFKAVLHFRKPDVWPWVEFLCEETILSWIKQGLPAHEIIEVVPGEIMLQGSLCIHNPAIVGINAYKLFGCIDIFHYPVPVDMGPIPRPKSRIISRHGEFIDFVTSIGAIGRMLAPEKYGWYRMPMYLEFPVKDRESWENYKRRLNPFDPKRYPKDWEKDAYIKAFRDYQDGPTVLFIDGFYGFGAQLMGIPNFVKMFYKDCELMHDMAEYWAFFVIETIRDAVETLKDEIDFVFWWEDLATKNGPNISPKIYKEFLLPRYKKVTAFLKKNKIDCVIMDSDGNTNKILDLAIEAGINGHLPLEVTAGMDAVALRKKYSKLFMLGNLDKRAIAKGGEAMKKEVDSKVPILKESGGYIPCADHAILPTTPLKTFREYVEYLKKYLYD